MLLHYFMLRMFFYLPQICSDDPANISRPGAERFIRKILNFLITFLWQQYRQFPLLLHKQLLQNRPFLSVLIISQNQTAFSKCNNIVALQKQFDLLLLSLHCVLSFIRAQVLVVGVFLSKKVKKLQKSIDISMILLVYCQSRFEWDRSVRAVASSEDGPERGRNRYSRKALGAARDEGKPRVASKRGVTRSRARPSPPTASP